MELRHLLYFKTVADELHFRNAASKLFISQPPLSRQIKELEEELGVILFERNNRRVSLTDAGAYFKREVDQIFMRLQESKHLVRQIHEAVSGELRIGYISSTYHVHLANVLREMRLVFPYVKTKLYEVPTVKQVRALEEGKLDLGIMRAPIPSDKLKLATLFKDPFAVVLPHSDYSFESIDQLGPYLKDQAFISFNQEYAPDHHRKLLEVCHRMGFTPDIVHQANNVHSILQLVEHGLGVSIVPRSMKEHHSNSRLCFIELKDFPVLTEVVLAHKPEHVHPAARWFIDRYITLFH